MNSQNDGGPAFPGIIGEEGHGNMTQTAIGDARVFTMHASGMSLRDWFAGQALANGLPQWYRGAVRGDIGDRYNHAATQAFAVADAMLAARKGTP